MNRVVANSMADYISKEEYAALLEISQIISSSMDVEEILDQSLQQLAKVVEASASAIWLLNESTQRLSVASATGKKSEEIKAIQLDIGEGIVGWVVSEGKPFMTQDARREVRHAQDVAEKLEFEGTTMACVPIRARDYITGAIQVMNKVDNRVFNDKDLFIMQEVANLTGIALENARLYRLVDQENRALRRELGSKRLEFRDIIGHSPKTNEMLGRAAQVAQTNSTVLLRGESGTGKELVAHAIHNASLRSNKPFIPVNCAALPDALLESELFGHERGAFTGAIARKEGRFELANSGTLFLDEIGDMPVGLQAKLLRVLQDRKFFRVGGTRSIQCDVRIIAATNQALEEKIKAGEFREDLYYRLNVISLELPPLRGRTEDIPTLAEHFLTKYILEIKRKKSGFSPQAMQMLMNYSWPGNIRELENAIEHAVVLGQTKEIQPIDFPISLHKPRNEAVTDYKESSLDEAQRSFKKKFIEHILGKTDGNRSQAAKILEIQRTYLSRLIKELNIQA
jgi:Nif-specific regulatory protein